MDPFEPAPVEDFSDELLIHYVRQYECIYNKKDSRYHKTQYRARVFRYIGQQMGVDGKCIHIGQGLKRKSALVLSVLNSLHIL